jgi:phospholipase C
MRRIPVRNRPLVAAAVALCLSACGGNAAFGARSTLPVAGLRSDFAARQAGRPKNKIQHVVIIVQENRSFNNLFYGYPGAKTVKFGYGLKGKKIALEPIPLETTWDLEHSPNGFIAACNGTGSIPGTNCRMNGFNNETWTCGKGSAPQCPIKYPPYAYVPHDEIKPYFEMAHQYVLADEMYSSTFDSTSFMSHQYIIAGINPSSSIGTPDGAWGCTGGKNGDQIAILGPKRVFPDGHERPCWDADTLGDELDGAGLSWSYYATPVTAGVGKPCGGKGGIDVDGGSSSGRGIWSAYQTIKHICHGAGWDAHVFSPPSQFLKDIARGKLAAVTWITPTYLNSDHGGSGSATGPSWVASLVNAIGQSQYWNSTAIFILWDDYGGWYDPEPPAYVDDDGLGMRLPLLIISPYAKQGFVSHVHYEHGSILKFVEDIFGLGRLAASDARANSPAKDCFEFSHAPRTFVPINAPLDENSFTRQPLDERSPDSD